LRRAGATEGGPKKWRLIVNKQRAQYGETKSEKREEKEGRNPDKALPLDHYRHLTIGQLTPRLKSLSRRDLQKVKFYEEKHKNRKGALQAIDAELRGR
jgi:ribosomal protein L13